MRIHAALRSSPRWRASARVALGLAVAASGVATLLIAQGPRRLAAYAGASDLTLALTVVAGIALGGAGLAVSLAAVPARRTGGLALWAGLVWFAPVWVGWDGGPPMVRSIGMLVAGLVLPLVLHAALVYPEERLRAAFDRAVVVTAWVGASALAVGRALFKDPFYDPTCWTSCAEDGNALLVHSSPAVAQVIDELDRVFTVTIAAAFAIACLRRLVTASTAGRSVMGPVVAPAVLFAAGVATHAVALVRSPYEDPADPTFQGVFVVTSAALIMLALGLVSGSLRRRRRRRDVARIAAGLGDASAPGSLEAALARAVGDPDLRIAYWLEESGCYVDASGRPVPAPMGGSGRVVTTLVRDEKRVAVVSHGQGVGDLEPEMGAAFRLALENERLQAAGLAHLQALRRSRTRIVETGDRERRRLERDLHDGAQQRLLAASYDIRLARASAESSGDASTGLLLSEALAETQGALDELRGLAHGLHPAILEEAGLAAALASLADTAPLVVDTGGVTAERYPSAVELAAYLLVVEAVEGAVGRRATRVGVEGARQDRHLVVVIVDDGTARATALVRSQDRVGALGGVLELGATSVRAVIPCG